MVKFFNSQHEKALRILESLKNKSLYQTQIAKQTSMYNADACEYLKEMEELGWVESHKIGVEKYYTLTLEGKYIILILNVMSGVNNAVESFKSI